MNNHECLNIFILFILHFIFVTVKRELVCAMYTVYTDEIDNFGVALWL